MSRLAQAVARQVEEMRGKMKRERRRTVDDDREAQDGSPDGEATATDDATARQSAGSPTEEGVADQSVEQTGATTTMAKKTKMAKSAKGGARKRGAAKATGRKKAARKAGRDRGARLGSLPSVGSLRPAEIVAEAKNVYVTIKFDNDFVVRLKPVNLDGPTTDRVRDLMVSYFRKALL